MQKQFQNNHMISTQSITSNKINPIPHMSNYSMSFLAWKNLLR